jgi:nucleoside-diphosphate-sugar epimerase
MFDISKAKAKGWTFKYNSEEAVRRSVRSMLEG